MSNYSSSKFVILNHCVPQGYVLGPILFLVYFISLYHLIKAVFIVYLF